MSARSPAITVTSTLRPSASFSVRIGVVSRHSIEKYGAANLLAFGRFSQI